MNFVSLFEAAVEQNPRDLAVVDKSSLTNFTQLNKGASRFAGALVQYNIKPQEKIAIIAGNTHSYLEVLFGCMKANVIASLINTRLSLSEVEAILKEDSVRAIVFDAKGAAQAEHLHEVLPDSSLLFVSIDDCKEFDAISLDSFISTASEDFKTVYPQSNDIAIQLFTGGTTGLPKAVQHSHRGLTIFMAMYGYTAKHCPTALPMPTKETFLCILPLYHMSGITALYALISGGRMILQDTFDMKQFLQAIQDFRVTRTTVPQTVIEWMLGYENLEDYNLTSLIELAYGGSPINATTIDRITKRLTCMLTQAYGSTEALIVTILNGRDHLIDPSTGDHRAYSVGKPMICAEYKVVDGQGKRCEPEVEGEIVVRTPALMVGYSNKTREESGLGEDGWFSTGDIGHTDAKGFLYITDRKHDLIISGGENIYPKEVEGCILQLKDDVAQVAVVGIPDKTWGETPVAFVVARPGSSITEAAIITHCESHIAHYKRPSKVFFLEALPFDNIGKISRKKLKGMAVELLNGI